MTDEVQAEESGFFAKLGSDVHAIKAWFHRRVTALEDVVKRLEARIKALEEKQS